MDDPRNSGQLRQGAHETGSHARRRHGEDAISNYLSRLNADLFPACTHSDSLVRPSVSTGIAPSIVRFGSARLPERHAEQYPVTPRGTGQPRIGHGAQRNEHARCAVNHLTVLLAMARSRTGGVASGIRCKSAGVVPGFMIRLGDGTDSFGAVGGLAGRDGAWPELGWWFEE